MVSGKTGIQPRFGPSKRILELAQHKVSKTIWVTTPCKLTWGNQDSIWPLSLSALGAVPTDRIQYLSKHKRVFSACDDHRRKQQQQEEEEEETLSRKPSRPSLKTLQAQHIVRLSTPKSRTRSSQEMRPPHTSACEYHCPIWHLFPGRRTMEASPRLLQLACPKQNHPFFTPAREKVETYISSAAKTARTTPRLEMLSLPKMKENLMFLERGCPEEPIWLVSKAAKKAIVSPRVAELSTPKELSKDYVPQRDPIWTRNRT